MVFIFPHFLGIVPKHPKPFLFCCSSGARFPYGVLSCRLMTSLYHVVPSLNCLRMLLNPTMHHSQFDQLYPYCILLYCKPCPIKLGLIIYIYTYIYIYIYFTVNVFIIGFAWFCCTLSLKLGVSCIVDVLHLSAAAGWPSSRRMGYVGMTMWGKLCAMRVRLKFVA